MMDRIVTVLSILLVSSVTFAFPGTGLKVKRVGNTLIIENPKVTMAKNLLKGAMGMTQAVEPPRAVSPIIQPDSLEGFELVNSARVTKQFAPGEVVVRHFSSGTGAFGPYGPESGTQLTETAWEAVELAPDWIRLELISNLALLAPELQDSLAKLMTEAENVLYLDEIAFLIANIAPEDLSREEFRPGYITDQVSILYAADPMLDFVELKEVGEPGQGDYWTTTIYKYIEEGEEKEFELDREVYYWYVVHPKLDGEELFDVNPQTGKYAPYPGGLTFREYYLMMPESPDSYTMHYIFLKQKFDDLEAVEYSSLNNWGPSHKGYFTDFVIGPLEITHDSQGRVTTFEFRSGKGTVVGTTLLLEKAYVDGKSDILVNMLRYGAGNVVHPEKWKHLVVRVPGGEFDGVVEEILADFEVDYEVVGPEFLYDEDLSEIRKIIVPSGQPLEVYEALADTKEKLEEWLKPDWHILEMHGTVPADDDWSGLVMPGGFTAAGLAEEGEDTVFVEGQPPLPKIIPNTQYLWDTEKYPGLPGERLFVPDSFALDKWGWWASQNMFDNVAEWMDKHGMPERSNYSVRIAWNHYGNCGECQDVLTSVSRTCLTAVANVSNPLEDHVWNEYFFEDGWHSYQISWSDSSTHIDHPGVGSGKKWGGGKNLSAVGLSRGDGMLINRTDYYTNTVTLTLNVVDVNQVPMEGVEILIASEAFYMDGGQYPLGIAHWGITGPDGKMVIELGANEEDPMDNCLNPDAKCNNYYVRAISDYGTYPPEDNTVDLVISAMTAVPGAEFELTLPIEGTRTSRKPDGVLEYQGGDPDRVIRIGLLTVEEMACGIGLYGGTTYCDPVASGGIDVYLLDQANVTAFFQDQPFKALAIHEMAGPGFELAALPPEMGDWFVVLVHQSRFEHQMLVDATFSVLEGGGMPKPDPVVTEDIGPIYEDIFVPADDLVSPSNGDMAPEPAGDVLPAQDEEDEVKVKEGGCSAGPTPEPGALALFLLLVGVLVLRRRTRKTAAKSGAGPAS